MNITREGEDYIIHVGKKRIACEGLGALLLVLGVAGLAVLFMLAAIF